jgi:hypothetical protein
MLEFLRGNASNRKLRLFACACCRRIWHLLTNERYRLAVELSEQAADGLITDEHIEDAWLDWIDSDEDFGRGGDAMVAALAATGVSVRWDFVDAHQHAISAATGVHPYYLDPANPAVAVELEAQTHLMRCIVGNPFRPVALDPAWLTWHNSIIPKLAHAIYDERAFDRLPILADAIEEAGCTDADVLAHLRGPGPHLRGCWVVDLILEKE